MHVARNNNKDKKYNEYVKSSRFLQVITVNVKPAPFFPTKIEKLYESSSEKMSCCSS
jgi:hypothetical protein